MKKQVNNSLFDTINMLKKTFIIIIFVFGFNLEAQTKLPTINSKNFTWEEKEQTKTFKLTFSYLLNDVSIPQDRLNTLIMNAIVKSKYKLKNKLTFRPIEVGFFKTTEQDKEELYIIVKYSGKNEYGIEQIIQSYFSFKNEGEGIVEFKFSD
jgi:hypothetical protein